MNNQQGPIRIIIETGKEYREGQKYRARKLRIKLMNGLTLSLFGFGYICYLFYQAVHP